MNLIYNLKKGLKDFYNSKKSNLKKIDDTDVESYFNDENTLEIVRSQEINKDLRTYLLTLPFKEIIKYNYNGNDVLVNIDNDNNLKYLTFKIDETAKESDGYFITYEFSAHDNDFYGKAIRWDYFKNINILDGGAAA